MKEITSTDFTTTIKNDAVVVDFFGDGCGNCKAMEPTMAQIEVENKNVTFVKINIKNAQAQVEEYDVMTLPTLLFFKNGVLVDKLGGLKPKTLVTRKFAEVFGV